MTAFTFARLSSDSSAELKGVLKTARALGAVCIATCNDDDTLVITIEAGRSEKAEPYVRGISPAMQQEIVARYHRGESAQEVSRATGIKPSTVYAVVQRLGAARKPRKRLHGGGG